LAGGHDICASIEAGDAAGALQQSGKQVMGGEGEITFSAAKVDDLQRAIGGQGVSDVIDEFEEAVDLTEFSGVAAADSAVCCHDTGVHQKRAGLSGGYQVVAITVMLRQLVVFGGLNWLCAALTV
jgi:hypothetical protein